MLLFLPSLNETNHDDDDDDDNNSNNNGYRRISAIMYYFRDHLETNMLQTAGSAMSITVSVLYKLENPEFGARLQGSSLPLFWRDLNLSYAK